MSNVNSPARSRPQISDVPSAGPQRTGDASEMSTPRANGSHDFSPRSSQGGPSGSQFRRGPRRYARSDISGGGRQRAREASVTPGVSQYSGGGRQTQPSGEIPHSQEGEDVPQSAPPDRTFVWGTSVDIDDVSNRIQRFMRNFREGVEVEGKYMQLLEEVMEREGESLNIDCANIVVYDDRLYKLLVRYPLEVIPLFDITVAEIARQKDEDYAITIQVRIFNLKENVNLRELNPTDIDQLVSVKGMVIRSSSVIPDIKMAHFQCLVCGQSPEPVMVDKGRIVEPTLCPQPHCLAKNSLTLIHNRSKFVNKQVMRLQETPDAIPEGETPHTVTVCCFDSLVDWAKPGDRVQVTGVFRATPVRVASKQRTLKALYKTYLDCIHIQKQEKGRLQAEDQSEGNGGGAQYQEGDSLEGENLEQVARLKVLSEEPDIYAKLARSLAPSIWELDDIKKGLLCQLFGGCPKKLISGARFRGDINLLLVGDPGTSKSQLLQYVHKIAPRGIYTSGRGSSAVGLTAYVTRDPESREMVLESGALVLSDRGICCIDEFDKMSENARSMLHEVMEQQTVSVAKAGIIASLNARTSVLACANPSGSRYNPRLSVIDNIQLPPTLLSRFDLIYLVLDKADEQNDRRLARFLVGLHYEDPDARASASIDPSTLSAYISYARQHIHPELSDEAARDLQDAYVEMRGRGLGRKVITATPRQLESLIRVSEALARMRFSSIVECVDVAEARRLLEVAMQQSATDPETGFIDMDVINTGISASERTKREQIRQAVVDLLQNRLQGSRGAIKLLAVFEEMKQQTHLMITIQQVKEAINSLAADGAYSFNGDVVRAI